MRCKWRFVSIDWLDAHSNATWVAIADLPKPSRITTRGWLVHETPDHVVVAGSFQHEEDEFGEVIAIPSGCIVSIEEI